MSAAPLRADGGGSGETFWHVYLLECRDGTLYCGITRDPERRVAQHNGLLPGGARYTRGRRPVRLVASLSCPDKGTALRLERAVKARPRAEKRRLLCGEAAGKGTGPC
ncbi:GIY-YIG nuclease family protein [uncultured Desulfovibrio sp.]|uniref:GIY-YIG nuclease family protein n=1 Tax=uncultured Desulfovibrio sp. TaxID=167968 RepID=UPI0025E8CF51|nr:GIY-YIG nuclease family protein [uncultured Desulfovibrio sp.]